MNSQEFVEAIKRHVMDAAVEDTIANLRNPPGRRVQTGTTVSRMRRWLK